MKRMHTNEGSSIFLASVDTLSLVTEITFKIVCVERPEFLSPRYVSIGGMSLSYQF